MVFPGRGIMSKFQKSRYYFCQLKEDFFKSHPHDVLRGMEGGREALLLYIELLLESAGHEGHLLFNDHMPFTPELISAKFQTPIEVVKSSLDLLGMLELVVKTESGELILPKFAKYVGSKTEMADYMANRREKKDEGLQEDKEGITKDNNVINSIENRDKSTENITSASHSPACAGARDASPSSDSAPFDFDWLVTDFEKLDVSRRFMAGRVITREELKAWYDWQNEIGQWKLGGGLAITKANYRKYVSYGIPKIRRMLRERSKGAAVEGGQTLHQITREEFAAYCAKQNEGFSVPQITGEEEEAVWASLVALNYHLLNGQVVTTDNIGYFTRPELKRLREEAEANRQQAEQEDVYEDPLFKKFQEYISWAKEAWQLRERLGDEKIKAMDKYGCLDKVREWAKQGLVPKIEDMHKYTVKDMALKARDRVRRIRAAEKQAKDRKAVQSGAAA